MIHMCKWNFESLASKAVFLNGTEAAKRQVCATNEDLDFKDRSARKV